MTTSEKEHLKGRKVSAKRVLTHSWSLLAFGFGSGLSPLAPGTFGTLVAIPLWIAASSLPVPAYATLTLSLFALGVYACSKTQKHLNVADHPGIVIDEIVGFFIALAFSPYSPTSVLEGFLLFRFFDILKPWPIRWADQHVHGGLGVMLDDAIAGVFSAICLWAIPRIMI